MYKAALYLLHQGYIFLIKMVILKARKIKTEKWFDYTNNCQRKIYLIREDDSQDTLPQVHQINFCCALVYIL